MSRAFVAILHAPRALVHNQVFNVGRTEENYRVREMAEIVGETVPGSRIAYADGAGADKRCYRVNCDKLLQTLPEFQPQWDARRGAKELYAAFKHQGLTSDEFEGARYKRLAHIKHLMSQGKLDSNLRWNQREPAVPVGQK
jgi:nucleoside-diphosphate-sugar epimerase